MLRKKVNSAVKYFCKNYPDCKTVVDVGCREGYSVDCFKKKGIDVIGIEVVGKWGRDGVITGSYTSHNFEHKYDAVFSRHSIEHLNTALFIEKCNKILNDCGIIFIVFPLKQWALINRGLDDERDVISTEDAVSDFRKTFGKYNELLFCHTKKVGIMPMDNDWLWIGKKVC